MSIQVHVTFQDIPDALSAALLGGLTPEGIGKVFPNTLRRLNELALAGQSIWSQRASQIPGAENRPLRLGTGPGDPMVQLNRSAFINSIRVRDIEPGIVEVFSADPQAQIIEEGGETIDLHAVLPYAPKAKTNQAGLKYLQIPFRHATTEAGGPGGQRYQYVSRTWGSNVLPAHIIQTMREKTRAHEKATQAGHFLPRPRLRLAEIEELGEQADWIHRRKLLGLMHVGKAGHKRYLTIRTLSEANPDGWRVPGYAAQRLAASTADELRAMADHWFDQALQADAIALVQAVGGSA